MQGHRFLWRVLLVAFCVSFLSACETVGYYRQAASGQFALLWGRESITSLLKDSSLNPQVRNKLELVLSARDFAKNELKLPVGDSYSQFVELDRRYVVWNVFAAPEFSTTPLNWCYPIAGCVAYRGYFSEKNARKYSGKLTSQGYEVYVGGVDAYSTLGWFDDPLTSSVLHRNEHQLVALVFHELAHQLVYVPGDTTFNESFASFVEAEGLRRWSQKNPQLGGGIDVSQEQRQQDDFVALVSEYRDQFGLLYEKEISEAQMRGEKKQLQTRLREEYELLRIEWGDGAYDRWFSGPLNNAQLATVSSYNDLVPAFAAMLEENKFVLEEFFAAVKNLAQSPKDLRDARLSEY